MGRFHKAIPIVESAYVILQDFTPDFQKIYTDISAISVTVHNSGLSLCHNSAFMGLTVDVLEQIQPVSSHCQMLSPVVCELASCLKCLGSDS